jgi:hypothetical protein
MLHKTPNRRTRIGSFWRLESLLKALGVLLALFGLLTGARYAIAGETPMKEYQVKALFLFNFAKYVDWPQVCFEHTNTPIIIAVLGESNFGDELNKAVAGKRVGGREVVVRQMEKDSDLGKCHILFISSSERKRLGEILNRINSMPILTVGETEQFTQQGGIINFIKKEGKVRLEIDCDAARRTKLQLSSKLLSVADVVKGKP